MLEPDASPPRAARRPSRRAAVLRSLLAVVVVVTGLALMFGTAPGAPTGSTAGTATAPAPGTALLLRDDRASRSGARDDETDEPAPEETGSAEPDPDEPADPDEPTSPDSDDDASTTDPLAVTLGDVTPAVLVPAADGVLTVSGTVTNTTDELWSNVRVYPLTSGDPMTDVDELAEASASDAADVVGGRLTTEGLFDRSITSLAPGDTQPFQVAVPYASLEISGEPGVYWLGVHALGETADGRTGNANGKARTFLPVVPAGSPTVARTSVLVPLREPIGYTGEGQVADEATWLDLFGSRGRLRHVLDAARATSASADPAAVTWLLDPAVLDVATRLAAGNPARSLAPSPAEREAEGTEGDGGGDGGDDGEESPEDAPSDEATEGTTPADPEVAEVASAWLEDALALLAEGEVLTLPYGDLDVTGATAHEPGAYARARALSNDALERYGLTGVPTVAPLEDAVSDDVLDLVEDDATLVLADTALPDDALPDDARLATSGGRTVVVADAAAADGGPSPGNTLSAVQVRQRLAAETALASLSGAADDAPTVVALPPRWEPGRGGPVTQGLDEGWLRAAPLSELVGEATTEVSTDELVDADAAAAVEALPGDLFERTRQLSALGDRLDSVLPATDAVATQVAREVAVLVGYPHRGDLARTRSRARTGVVGVDNVLGAITVEVPPTVTLSSDTGRFAVRVENGLDQPVVVELRGGPGSPVTLDNPGEVEVGAGSSTSVLVVARADYIGVFDVEVLVTDAEGVPLGGRDVVPVRSAAVSDIIWVVIGGAVVLLVVTVGYRVLRRVRGSDDDAAPRTADTPGAGPAGGSA